MDTQEEFHIRARWCKWFSRASVTISKKKYFGVEVVDKKEHQIVSFTIYSLINLRDKGFKTRWKIAEAGLARVKYVMALNKALGRKIHTHVGEILPIDLRCHKYHKNIMESCLRGRWWRFRWSIGSHFKIFSFLSVNSRVDASKTRWKTRSNLFGGSLYWKHILISSFNTITRL